MSRNSWLLRSIGLVIGLGLFGWVFWDALRRSQSLEWPALPIPEIALTCILVIIAHGLHGLAWTVGARKIASQLGWWDGIGVYSLSFLGRYLPGKIWQIGGISYLARNKGAEPYQIAGYSLAFLIAFQVIGALLLLEAYILRDHAFGWMICLASAPVIALGLAAIYCLSSANLIVRLPTKFQDRLRGALHQPFGALALNLLLLAFVWLIFGTSGFVLANGFAPDWNGTWSQASSATIGGLIAGFLVLIAPSGAGVRESAISVSLTSMGVSPIASIALAVALRVAMTACELLWAALGAVLLLRTPPDPEQT